MEELGIIYELLDGELLRTVPGKPAQILVVPGGVAVATYAETGNFNEIYASLAELCWAHGLVLEAVERCRQTMEAMDATFRVEFASVQGWTSEGFGEVTKLGPSKALLAGKRVVEESPVFAGLFRVIGEQSGQPLAILGKF